MKKGRRTVNRLLSWLLAVAMVITMLPVSATSVKAETTDSTGTSSVKLDVDQSRKLEVALAVGNTKQNYSAFETDLKAALKELGINEGNISFVEVDASASASQESFPWWTYDHSTGASINHTNHEYIEAVGTQATNDYNSLARHIVTSDSGKTMKFYGYGSSAYKDFNYLPNNQATKKTIEFTIQEGDVYDALDGIGFLVNTSVTGTYGTDQIINGYLIFLSYNGNGSTTSMDVYQLTNVNTKLLHTLTAYKVSGLASNASGTVKKIATAKTAYGSTYANRKIRMEIEPDSFKMWYKGAGNIVRDANGKVQSSTTYVDLTKTVLTDNELVNWTYNNATVTEIPFDLEQYGYDTVGDGVNAKQIYRGGYGPLVSYCSHGCNGLTNFTLSNLQMEAEYVRSLTEVVREPSWSEDKVSFLVNLNEDPIEDFSEAYTTSEIISRLEQEKVTYIGWCGDKNKDDSQVFVNGISEGSALVNMNDSSMIADGKTYYDNASYLKQVKRIAEIIVDKVSKQTTEGEVYTYLDTDNFRFSCTGATLDDGNWSVGYSSDSFDEAHNSVSNYANLAAAPFTMPGYYEVYYGGDTGTAKAKIRIHQAPKALFSATVSENGTVIVKNSSYDPDVRESGDGASGSGEDGIVQSKLEYRNVTDSGSWSEDAPSEMVAGDVWMIRLTVTDTDGASDILVQQISRQSTGSGGSSGGTEPEKKPPYNAFALSKTQYIQNIDTYVEVYDQSYTLDGETFTVKYTLKDSTGKEYNNTTTKAESAGFLPKQTNRYTLSNLTAGTYTLSMTATSESGKTSEAVSRTFSVKVGYPVTYHVGEGSGAPATQYKISGETLTLSAVEPSCSGKIFAGWATSEGATTATYQPGASYTGNAALNLYAVWKKPFVYATENYTGVYDGDGHNITVKLIKPEDMTGVTIYYADGTGKDSLADSAINQSSFSLTDAGTYKVFYKITHEDYLTVSGYKTVTIGKADPEVVLTNKVIQTADGSQKTVDAASVTGVKEEPLSGTVTCTYYTDKELTKKTEISAHGASQAGGAPSKKGHYFVQASYVGNNNYNAAKSNVVTLDIEPDVYYINEGGTKSYGILSDILKAEDNPSKRIYIKDSMTIDEDTEIPEGYTLFIAGNATVTLPEGVTLTNNGTIRNSGIITGDGKIVNNKKFDGGNVGAPFENNGDVTYTDFSDPNEPEKTVPVENNSTLNDCSGGQVTNGENGEVKNNDEVVTYTVSFDAKANLVDKTLVDNPTDQSINCGDKIVEEPAVSDIEEVAEFQGWYQDQACSEEKKWDFAEDTVNGDITLYAKWKEYAAFEAYWTDDSGEKHYGTFEQVLEDAKKAQEDGKTGVEIHIQKEVSPAGDVEVPADVPVVIDEDGILTLKPDTIFDAPGGITNNGKIEAADREGDKPVIKCGDGDENDIINNGSMDGIKADSDVKNNENATISNSELAKDLDNSGNVSDSKADGNVTNHESGTLADTEVDAEKLKNEGQYTTGGSSVTNTVTYNVTPASGDGITITCTESDEVVFGGRASFERPTVTPEGTDLVFSGWYKDDQYSEEWKFDTDVVTKDEDLYTKLQPKSAFEVYWKDPYDPNGGMTYGSLAKALTSGSPMVTIRGDITLPDSMEIPQGMTVIVNEDVTVTIPNGGTLSLEGTLINNGTLNNDGVISGDGQLTNKKSINGGAIETDVVNDGKINEVILSGPVTNNGQIVSSELRDEVTNNGTIYDSKLTEDSHVTNNKNISGCDIQGEVTNEGDGKIIDKDFSEVSYQVAFDLNGHGGEITPEKQTIICGKKIVEPARIVDDDYYLTGWYLDQACTESKKWNFATDTVSKDIALYAGWREKNSYEVYWINENGETEYGTLLEAAKAAKAAKDTENKVSEIHVQNDVTVSEAVALPEGTKLVVKPDVTVTVDEGAALTVPGGIENSGTIKADAMAGEKPEITGPVTNKQGASIQGCDITGDVENSGAISGSTINGETTNNTTGTITGSDLTGDVDNSGAITDTDIKAENVTNDGKITGGSIAGKEEGRKADVSNKEGGELSDVDVTGDVTNDGTVSDGTKITGDVNNNGTISEGTTINGKTTNGESGTITGSSLNGDVDNSGAISGTDIEADSVKNNGSISESDIKADDVTNDGDITGGSIAGKTEDKANVINSGNLNNSDLKNADVDNTNGTMTGEGDKAITHTVTFDLNGHGDVTQTPDELTVAYDKLATCPANPQDDNYTMTGWYKEAACTNKWDFAKDTVKTDITLYAKWETKSAYEAYWTTPNGEQRYGSLQEALESGSSNVTIQKNVTLQDGMVIPEGMQVTIPENTVVTIPEGTTVTVDGELDNAGTIYNNGAIAGDGTVKNEKAIYGGSIAPAVENSGKIDGSQLTGPVTNSGRITDSTLTNDVTNTSTGAITDSTMSGNVTNDGTISGGSLTEDSHVTNNKNISGCDIKGNVVNTEGGKIVDSSLDGIQYQVAFDGNGHGENIPGTQTIDCGRTVTEPEVIKDAEYVFIGWFKEGACENKWNFNTDTVNGNMTLFAGWRAKNTYEAYWVNEAGEFEYGTLAEVLENALAAGGTEVHVQENALVAQALTIPEGMQVTVDPGVTLTLSEGASLTVNGLLTNQGTIEGVTGSGAPQIIGNMTNTSGAEIKNCSQKGDVDNAGSITASTVEGNVTNTGDIAGSTINGDLTNNGFVKESTLNGNLNNAAGGELENSAVNGDVDNAGAISGGSINGGEVNNSGEIFAADIHADTIRNDGEISEGSIEGTVTNGSDGVISGVFVTGDVTNDGTITNGSTISGKATNNGTIKDSTLNGDVDNKGTLENSNFDDEKVDNSEGTVKDDQEQTVSYTVSFDTGAYGESPQPQTVAYGKKAICPADPVDEAYAFAGWYQDAALEQVFDFDTTAIKQNTVIYGKWVSKSETEAYWTVNNETKYGTLEEALASGSKDIHITKSIELVEDITIPEGATVTVDSGVTIAISKNADLTVAKDAQLINNGKLDNNGTIAGEGTVINNKNITGGTVDTDITNNGTVNSAELNGQVTNNKAINDCEINAGLNNQNGTVSKDGDQVVYTDTLLKGTVVKEAGDAQQTQANATIKLMQGNKVIQTVKTDADGTYDFSEVPSGIYNIVIESAEGNINTLLAQVSGDAIQMEEITLPEGNLNNAVEVKEGAPDVVVGGLDAILTGAAVEEDTAGITQADKDVADQGGSVEVRFVAEQIDQIPADELDMEKVIEEDNKKAGMNLNLTILKTVAQAQSEGEEKETKLTQLQEPIMINIPIDEEMQGKKNYVVYRFHDGSVDRITENSGEEYIEVREGGTAITLYAKKFSTYVLAYDKDTSSEPEKPGTENPSEGTDADKPDKGESGGQPEQKPSEGADTKDDPYAQLTDEQKKTAQAFVSALGLTEAEAVELLQFAEANGIDMDTLLVTENTILTQKDDSDINGSSFAKLSARTTKLKTTSAALKWNKVKGADGYLVYGNKCGSKNKYKLITTITGNNKTSFTQKKLKKGSYYKYVVRAYKQIGDKKITIALSKTVHATTTGGNYGVAKSVKVNKTSIKLNKGKTFKLKAQEVKQDKKIKRHRNIAFESSDPAVATVNKNGVIKGVKKGTCYVYAYAQNGVYKRIKVTVK